MNHYKAFKAFVSKQPPEQAVDHKSWWSCAVGDYARSIGITENYLQPITDHIEEQNKVVWSTLNWGGIRAVGGGIKTDINTYGELSEFLRNWG